MAGNVKKPFKTLAVRYFADEKTSVFSVGDAQGACVDPYEDSIAWILLAVYGIPDGDELLDDNGVYDFSSATLMGNISICHIPRSLIINLDADPYSVCDSVSGDLEAMYSVFTEYEEILDDLLDDIFYINEIELKPEYTGMGYEKILLQQLPSLIIKAIRVFPAIMLYFPRPLKYDEYELDSATMDIIRHRLEYANRNTIDPSDDDNISYFPPKHDLSEKDINYVLGRRNAGSTVPESHRDKSLYRLYKSCGFSELGKTGWLYKKTITIYS